MSIFEVKNGNLVRKDAATASELAYSNTTSGLSASTVQEAIDELDSTLDTLGGEVMPSGGSAGQVLKKASGTDYDAGWDNISASEVGYDNTGSGLTADDVQEAIDELSGEVDTLGTDKQPKTLDTSITIDGTPETTVETALDGLNEATKKRMTYADNGVLGAKNLLVYPYKKLTKNGTTAIITDNGDGTFTFNGTAAALTYVVYGERNASNGTFVPNGTYIVTGCPSGGSGSAYYAEWSCTKNGAKSSLGVDFGDGATITINGDDYSNDGAYIQAAFYVNAGTVDLVWRPMLRLASDTDATYWPYAMTNQELTGKLGSVSLETGFNAWTINMVARYGLVATLNVSFTGSVTANAETLVGTIPAGFRPRYVILCPCYSSGRGMAKLGSDGTIKLTSENGGSIYACIAVTYIV